MKRREFFKIGSLGSTLMASRLLSGSEAGLSEIQSVNSVSLIEKDINFLVNKIKTGKLTSRQLCKFYLDRIRKMDKTGPALNSVLEINPDVLKIADELDRKFKDQGLTGPLHGIPVLIKGNIDTHDKMTTTAGSLALEGSIPPEDAFIVKKLREAGAVILGKANLSEWANFRSTRSSSGWSSQGGQTKNPYILDRNPCGSSSGSGVAVSANLCAIAIGTETDGSIVCPSNANGIVGIKPTIGLVSRNGIIPISHSQDTAGPMARTVSDAVILLTVMAGFDQEDQASGKIRNVKPINYTKFLDNNGLNKKRIGVARNYFGFHEKVDDLMEDAIKVIKKMGGVIVDPANIETKGKFNKEEYDVLLYEFKAGLNEYLRNSPPETGVKTLTDLIGFNKKYKNKMMPYFEQEIFIMAEKKGPLTDKKYLQALKKCKELAGKNGIDATMYKYKLDAIIAPTGGPAWKTDHVNGDHFGGGSSSAAAVAGYPNITVPAGFVHELPVGISFFGKAFTEPALISIAYAYEQATKHRRPPQFRA
ncbi:MAG: amidase [Acidobacteriota bacterium]